MFVHHCAYRHLNGDIEEFAGSGLTPASARQNSVYCAQAAMSMRSETFTMTRMIVDRNALDPRERARINAQVSARSYDLGLV